MATTKHAPVPSLIKAVRIAQYGGPEQLKYEEAPLPEIGPGRVLARVSYAGVNPVDWKIREGYMKQVRPASFPLTLGQDFAGEIVTLGGDSGLFRTGERVFGFGAGTYAEFTAAAITEIAAIPEKIEFELAAALPTAGLTALQAIRDYVQPRPGSRILIHGAAGSVGSFATQIAKRLGALVSTVGAANAELAVRAGIRGVNMVVKRSAPDLLDLAGFVERGDVKPRRGEVFRLEQARDAQDASQQGRGKGKILLKVA
jgi:NADPH:quinone reductase-like Zn-dependent oxidoreductase